MSEASSKSPHLDRVTQNFIKNLEARDTKPLYELTPHEARPVSYTHLTLPTNSLV